MPSPFRAALHEEFRLRSLGVLAVGLVAVRLLFDASLTLLATATVFGLAAGLLNAASEADHVDDRRVQAVYGAVIVVAGCAWTWTATRTEPPAAATLAVPAGGVLVGLWILLDAASKYQMGLTGEDPPIDRDLDSREVMLTLSVASTVFDALDEEHPKTVAEIAEACDLSETRVEESLAMHADQGMVEERPEGYVTNPAYTGRVRPLVTNVRRVGRRILRPFSLLAG